MNAAKEGVVDIGPYPRTDSVQDRVTLCTSQQFTTSTFTAESTSESKSGHFSGDNHQGVATYEYGDEELLGLVVRFQRSSAPTTTAISNKFYGKVMTTVAETTGVRQEQKPAQTSAFWNEVTGSPRESSDGVKPTPLSSAWIDVGSAVKKWHRTRWTAGLASNEDLANFLLQQYEDAPGGKWSNGCCVHCCIPLSCRRCGWTSPLPPSSLHSSTPPCLPSNSPHVVSLNTGSSMEMGRKDEPVSSHSSARNVNHSCVYAASGTVDGTSDCMRGGANNGSLVRPSAKEPRSNSPSKEGSSPLEIPSVTASLQTPAAVSDSLTSAPSAEFECDVCKTSFTNFKQLSAHLQAHVNDVLHKCKKSWLKAGFAAPDITAPKNFFLTHQVEDVASTDSVATSKRSTRIQNRKDAHDVTVSQHSKKATAKGPHRPVKGRIKRTVQVAASAKKLKSVVVKNKRDVWGIMAVNVTSDAETLKPAEAGFKASASDVVDSKEVVTGVAASACDVTTSKTADETPNLQAGSRNLENQPAPKRKGFSISRWLKEHGKQPLDGQPTQCTQTPVSDPLMPYTCLECDAKFEHRHKLVMHRRRHTGERPFRCLECNSTFAQSSHLKQHMLTHSGDRPFACPHCPARFARSGALAPHINTHTGNKPHKCELCAAAFCHRTTLASHMKVHTGAKPYLCSECGRTFAHTSNLKKHLLTHTGTRPHVCHLCSKAFSDSVNLKRHIRTHTGVKPFKCDQCLKAFGTSDALRVHMRTHTGERPFSCQHCPKAFTTLQSLKKHASTQHRLTSDVV